MNYSQEQLQAINDHGQNILVSAGAGSGKTAVLTERVITLLKNGCHLNELLILTFTKASAGEMKERIRQKLLKIPSLKKELDKIDEAFITTFDSFSLFVVKKYHYLLNLPQNPLITDSTFLEILKRKCLQEVLEKYYQQEEFQNLIEEFCSKDDDTLVKDLFQMINKLSLKNDIEDYLNNYEPLPFKKVKKDYEKLILQKKAEIIDTIEELTLVAPKEYITKLNTNLNNFYQANSYEENLAIISFEIPRLPNNSPEEITSQKEKLVALTKEFKNLFVYENELENTYNQMQKNNKIIINILKDYFIMYEQIKKENNYFDFQTIANYALELLKNEEIRNELKNSFKEIMIDEYQDTNDIQEKFISLIANNNVYMVGDIKQSIYRFRNANPQIFFSKYQKYQQNNEGIKIDLLKNFRSRQEVINNINLIFSPLMDLEVGGADYQKDHMLIFGNKLYQELQQDNNQMEIYEYSKTNELNEEIEAFWIAKEIQNQIKSNKMIVDFKTKQLRPINYNDFCILMDRSTNFNTYQKIFTYLNIPLTVYKDAYLNENIHFQTIKNIFIIISKLMTKNYDDEFKFAYTALARGFLFAQTDEEIYNTITNNKILDSTIIKTLKPILKAIDSKTLRQIYHEILEVTNYYEKIITIGKINEALLLLERIDKLIIECQQFGYSYLTFINYLSSFNDYQLNVKYKENKNFKASVSIMTIHASKGLEFPICFYSGLSKKFNIDDLKEPFMWDKKYGFLSPINKEGIIPTFVKTLIKNEFINEEISEKIRLFYVALTRAKEKMLFILPEPKETNNQSHLSKEKKLKMHSFADFIYNINQTKPYLKKIDITSLNITKDYLIVKEKEELIKKGETLVVEELKPIIKTKTKKTFSKKKYNLITKEEANNLQIGIKFHQYLQFIDFHHPNFELINDEFIKNKIKHFYNQELIQNKLNYTFYQEYEFYEEEENNIANGIIDLLIITPNEAIIIDYKLKNTDNEAYQKQLKGYYDYITKTFKLKTTTYLYSIIAENFTILNF